MAEASRHVTGDVRLRLRAGSAVVTAAAARPGCTTTGWPPTTPATPSTSARQGLRGALGLPSKIAAGRTGRRPSRPPTPAGPGRLPAAPRIGHVHAGERNAVAASEAGPRSGSGRKVRDRASRGARPAVGQRPVRLAAGPVRPARLPGARAGAAQGRLLDDIELARLLAALDDLGRACGTGASARPRPTRTCTPRWSAAAGTRRITRRQAAAGRSRNDQVATDLRLYLRDHARLVTLRLAELETR